MVERTILVVDDEPLIRMTLTAFFEDKGYTVLEAECADAAIATLERNPAVRVVVTDVQMPGSMDGVKLAQFYPRSMAAHGVDRCIRRGRDRLFRSSARHDIS